MVIFRGVNIYPGQVDEVLNAIEGLGSEHQVLFDHASDGRDYMLVRVERSCNGEQQDGDLLTQRIISGIKHTLQVSCRVDLLEPGSLPRSERKTRRVFDQRRFE